MKTKPTKKEDFKWKMGTCPVGAKCWCRSILTLSGKEVIPGACICKADARMMVRIHNEWLKLKQSGYMKSASKILNKGNKKREKGLLLHTFGAGMKIADSTTSKEEIVCYKYPVGYQA